MRSYAGDVEAQLVSVKAVGSVILKIYEVDIPSARSLLIDAVRRLPTARPAKRARMIGLQSDRYQLGVAEVNLLESAEHTSTWVSH